MGARWQRKKNLGAADAIPYSSQRWRRLRLQVMKRDHWLCQLCLPRLTPAIDCDHIIPRAQGGSDALTNLRALCRACHLKVTYEAQGMAAPIIKQGSDLSGRPKDPEHPWNRQP